MSKPLLAIVVPVFNEHGNLRAFYDAVTEVMQSLGDYAWEFVFVDDGSRDGSFEVLTALRERDDRVHALRFPRNFGSHDRRAAGWRTDGSRPASNRNAPESQHEPIATAAQRHGVD